MRHLPQLVGLCLLASLSNTAMAGWVLFHQQGQPGQREAYFAEITRTTERTEVDQMLGSGNGAQARTSVWEMPVMVVHESANAPEWTELKLQFECPVEPVPSSPKARRATGPAVAAPLRWRMGERSYQFTRDADNVPLPPTPWQSVSNPAYRKAGMARSLALSRRMDDAVFDACR